MSTKKIFVQTTGIPKMNKEKNGNVMQNYEKCVFANLNERTKYFPKHRG